MTGLIARTALIASFLAAASVASAQTATQPAPTADDAVAAAKNQLGVLEYCQHAGHIDGKATDVQLRMLGMLPQADDTAKVDAAYAKGQEGTVSAMGVEQSLADAAKAQGAEEGALCQRMAQMVEQAGTQLQ